MKKKTNSTRSKKYHRDVWDLNDILDGKTPEDIIEELKAAVEAFKRIRPQLTNTITPAGLSDILRLKERIKMLASKVGNLYALKYYENVTDSKALAKMNQMSQLMTSIDNEVLFFSLWFMHLDDKVAARLLASKELERYVYYLAEIRKLAPYTKSEEIEKILNLKSITGAESLVKLYEVITSSFKFKYKGKMMSQEEVITNSRSKDPKDRQLAYETVIGRYKENSTVLNQLYNDIALDWYNESVKIRGYKDPITVRNVINDVEDKAVDALLNVVRKNAKLFADYFKLKYELNKKAGQRYPYSRFHLYAPYQSNLKEEFSYEYSKAYVLDTYKMFDERFYKAAKDIFDRKHVHSHPAPGKRGGAFCECVSTDKLPYLLLNHTGKLRDIDTMIHELGHGIHYTFSQVQTNFTYHASLPMAETASVFSEMMLFDRLIRESKDAEQKKALLIYLIDSQYGTIGRQGYFVIFEKLAHDLALKGATKEELDKVYYDLLKEQFGEMEIPELFSHEWNYIPHIHETPFYCYAYAWGNLMVLAFFNMYKKDPKGFVEKYIKLLSYGGGKAPKDILAEMGVDPADEKFWQSGYDIIRQEIEELKKLSR